MLDAEELTRDGVAAFARFHGDVYCGAFPDEDERESLENMLLCLDPATRGWGTSDGYHIVVARDGDRILGAAVADYFSAANAGVLEFLVVDPAIRGRGLGRRLLKGALSLLDADARRARGAPLSFLLAETNDPALVPASMDSMDPARRTRMFHRWGFLRLSLPYVQPPLAPGRAAVAELMLICLPMVPAATLASAAVGAALSDYMRLSMRVPDPEGAPGTEPMWAALAASDRVGLASLSVDPAPPDAPGRSQP